MSFWTLYWLSRLDGLKGLSIAFAVMLGASICVVFFVWSITKEPYLSKREERVHKQILKWLYLIIPIFMLSIVSSVLTPTFKQALTFMGIDYVTHNERVLENTDKAIDVFEAYIDKKLNQLEEGDNVVE